MTPLKPYPLLPDLVDQIELLFDNDLYHKIHPTLNGPVWHRIDTQIKLRILLAIDPGHSDGSSFI